MATWCAYMRCLHGLLDSALWAIMKCQACIIHSPYLVLHSDKVRHDGHELFALDFQSCLAPCSITLCVFVHCVTRIPGERNLAWLRLCACVKAAGYAGPLSAEPSFAFDRKPHLACTNLGAPSSRRLHHHPQPFDALHTRHAALDAPASRDAQAGLHQPYASFSAGQHMTATSQHAVPSKQAAEPSVQQSSSAMQQPDTCHGVCEHSHWDWLPSVADGAEDSCGAAGLQASAYAPQELADHRDKLKKEFRQIYSTILDGDGQPSHKQEAALMVVSLLVKLACGAKRLSGVTAWGSEQQSCLPATLCACVAVCHPYLAQYAYLCCCS